MSHMMKVQSKSSARRRLRGYHPQLETLEARLPLGDALLSTLLGSSLLGSSLFRDDPSSWAIEGALTDAFPANHSQAHLGTGSVLETDTPDSPQILSRDPFRLQGQPSEAQGSNARTSAAHVVANRDSDALSWSSKGVLFGIGDDLDSALTGDALRGFVPFWDAAGVPTRRQFAGSVNGEQNSSDGSGTGAMPLLSAHQTADSGSGMTQPMTESLGSKGLAGPLPAGQSHGPHSQATGELSFRDPIDYAAGRSPRSVATGDFRGIGIQDLAVANSDSNDVSIFLGNGDSTFRLAETVVVGTNPYYVTTGHFHDPGILDLAVANSGSNNVSILLGHGDGSFGLPHSFQVGQSPRSIAVGDFNGDKIADLAVANQGSNSVSILLGNGDGTFNPAATVAVQGPATSVAAGDFNGDGKLDLAVTTTGPEFHPGGWTLPGAVSIFLGNGDGTFHSGQNLTVGVSPISIVTGDFKRDGVGDLAIVNGSSWDVNVLLGNGDGTIAAPQTYQVGGTTQSIAVGDFNGDGIPDIVTVGLYSSVSVLLGNGDGTFQTPQYYWGGANPISVAVGDFNRDGLDDLAIAQNSTNQVSVLLNNSPQPGDGVTVIRDIVYYDGPYSNPNRENLDVYLPPVKDDFPVVFLVYGGAMRTGSKSAQAYLARTLAREGLGVVAINYRITDGTPDQVVHPGHVTDAARAFAWMYNHIGEFGGNVDKIIMMGHSSGGFLVSLLATDRQYLAAQGLSPDLVKGVIGFSGGYDLRNLTGMFDVIGDLEQRWEASPLKHVDGTQPPFLVLYASNDMPGTAEDSSAFYEALVKAGSEAELHMIPGRTHQMIIGNAAHPGDPARELMLRFIAEHTK